MAEIEGYNMPDELYYHKDHAWLRVEEDNTVTVGMNDMFQQSAGDVVYVDLPFEDDEAEQGEVCGKIQSAKWIGDLVAPLSGVITVVNEELEDDPTLINNDPYRGGWIMKVEPANLDEELGSLMQGAAVVEWLKGELEKAEKLKEEG